MTKVRLTVYHGTSQKAAKSIEETQEIHDSQKNDEWLGHGAYFFVYPGHAIRWIYRNTKLQPGKIIKAKLEFKPDQLLDLDDPDQLEQMNKELLEFCKKIGRRISIKWPESKEKLHRIWCWGCDTYRELHREIGIICYTFAQNKYAFAPHYHYTEKQLCVSNHQLIKELTQCSGIYSMR